MDPSTATPTLDAAGPHASKKKKKKKDKKSKRKDKEQGDGLTDGASHRHSNVESASQLGLRSGFGFNCNFNRYKSLWKYVDQCVGKSMEMSSLHCLEIERNFSGYVPVCHA